MATTVNRRISIYIDQSAAEDALKKLQAKADGLTKSIAAGQAAGKNMAAEIRRLADTRSAIDAVQNSINNGLRPTMAQVANQVSRLRNELRNMSEDAPEYAARFQAFQQANATFQQMQGRISGVRQAMQSLGSQIRGVAVGVIVGNTIQAGLEKISGYFSGLLSGAAKLSDALSDLQRVAGLTAGEASDLNKALGKIDTRTSTEGLREIAIVAGKLGVAKNDLVDFTAATDQLVVALGDELGNADQITTSLGKILNVFEGKVTAEDLSKLGNSFVELANAGVATGGFIADFTQRVAGISVASNVSLGSTVGLAAGFEELGLRSESSATAFQKLLSSIASDIPAAAKLAGVPLAEFNDLFGKSPQEALIKYAEGLTRNKSGFAEITKTFQDAGEDGARVIQTLQAIGQSGDFLRAKIDLGNKSIQETSAITEAFALKNTNLAAEIDKLGKKFNAFTNSKTLQDFLIGAVSLTSKFIDVLKALPKFIGDNAVAFGLFTAALVVNNLARLKSIALYPFELLGLKQLAFNVNAARAAKLAYAVVVNLLSGNITKAMQAFNLLKVAIGTNPLGLLLIATGALVLAFKALASSINQASAAEQVRQKIQEQIIENTTEEISKINFLTSVIKDNNISLDGRKKALEELKAIAPEYLKGLTLENIAYEEGTDILDRYIKNLRLKAALEASQKLRTEYAEQEYKIRLKIQEIDDKLAGRIKSGLFESKGTLIYDKQDLALELLAIEKLNEANDELAKSVINIQNKEKAGVLFVPDDITNPNKKKAAAASTTTKEEDKKKGKEKVKKDLKELGEAYSQFQTYIESLNITAELDEVLEKSKKLFEGTDATNIADDIARLRDLNNRDLLAGDEIAVIQAQGKKKLDAETQLLEDQRDVALQAEDLTQNERMLIYLEYNQKIEELNREHWQGILGEILKYAQDALGILNSFNEVATNRENAELDKDRKVNDEKRKNLQRQLNAKLISQGQYNAQLDAINAAQDAKEEAAKKKQFDRNKKLELAQAGINGAQAVLSTLAKFGPPIPPNFLGIAAMLFTVGSTVANLAAISSKKYGKGGLLDGPSHSENGMPVIDPRTGRKVAEVEGGEVILSKATVRNNRDIVGRLLSSSMNRGGETIRFPWENRTMQRIDFGGVTNTVRRVKKYETGGVFDGGESGNVAASISNELMQQMLIELRKPKRNYVVLTDITDNQAQLARIVDDASVGR